MKWTEQMVFEHVAKHNGPEIAKLINKFIKILNDDEFYKFGKGDDFPSIKIFNKSLSQDHQIIGIEFFKLGTSEPGFQYWVNLKDHQDSNKTLMKKIREFLGDYKKICPTIEPESPSNLPHEVRSILQIIHDHFRAVSS
jgi:hypothetical protein